MTEYAFSVGDEGADRLGAVENLFGAASREFLSGIGLHEGHRVLDVGCGTGTLTGWIARRVGVTGHVVALDPSAAQLDVARASVREKNVEFIRGGIGDPLPSGEFDIVHSRLVLMHVSDVEGALQTMLGALRPKGILVCEETSASSTFTTPDCAPIARMNDLFGRLGRQRGLDSDIGDRLYGLIAARVAIIGARLVQPMVSMAEAKRFLELGASELGSLLLASGLATETEAGEMLAGLRAIPEEPTAFYAPGRLAQVAGRAV